MIEIEKRGKRIAVVPDGPLPGFRNAFPGAYETASGIWTLPLNMETCVLLRQKYGRQLKVGNELARWARGVRDNRNNMRQLANAEDAVLEHLPRVAPKLAAAMENRPYQKVGARFIADNPATLEADEPGLGKTLICMGGILESQTPGPYLVVAPKTAGNAVWAREIERWLPRGHRVTTMPTTRLGRERALRLRRFGPTDWVVVHPEIVLFQMYLICHECGAKQPVAQRQRRVMKCGHVKTRKTKRVEEPSYPRLFDIQWGAIVVDECHESLIQRTKVPTQRRLGLERLPLRSDGLRIAMSGTPMDSKPHQLFGALSWLYPETYTAFFRWAQLFWKQGGFTGFEIGEFIKEREKMLWDSLDSVAIRRTKLEVAKDLPPKMEVGYPLDPHDETSPLGIWLDMEGKQARAYEQMMKDSWADLKNGRLDAVGSLAELTRLKQLASAYGRTELRMVRDKNTGEYVEKATLIPELPSNKFDWCVEALEEWGYPKNPLTRVIFVSFYTGVLDLFAENFERHFKRKPDNPLTCAITGRISSAKKRREIISRFNGGGGPDIMMLNVKAGGTAITIDTADIMVFLSETRIPDQQLQAEDRIHRVSNPRQCTYYYLRSLGSVDVGTAILNQQAIRGTHQILDARRGVEYFREVMSLSS